MSSGEKVGDWGPSQSPSRSLSAGPPVAMADASTLKMEDRLFTLRVRVAPPAFTLPVVKG